MSDLRVLVCGASIAGPTVAYWLAKAGAKVTVVERAPELRTGGQNVDIRGHGLRVIQRMGLEDEIRAKTTQEKGFQFVDKNNIIQADFPMEDGEGFSSDIEILRGRIAQVLFNATKDKVEYIFNDRVSALHETSTSIQVEFENTTSMREFDIVIAADGCSSSTRRIAFGTADTSTKPLGQWGAWFTIPWAKTDVPWARWYNAPGGRMIMVRPDSATVTRASIWIISRDPKYDEIYRASQEEQKTFWREVFDGAGWETDRILDGMDDSDDFYMQQVVQVKNEKWFTGRTVLVGDACYCPSPVSGMGTTLGIVGAYVLAGEIVKNKSNLEAAFTTYQERMRPLVAKAQSLPPGAPAIACPQTAWGIRILHWVLAFIRWSGISKMLSHPPASAMELPEYSF